MDKNVLNLDENEFIFYEKKESYVFYKEDELELFITNFNIILVNETTRMFKKSTYEVIKLPLAKIKLIDNIPQITIENDDDYSCWNIVILFNNGIKKIGIYYGSIFEKNQVKNEAMELVDKISQLRMEGTIVLKRNKASDGEGKKSIIESDTYMKKKKQIKDKISATIVSFKKQNKQEDDKDKALISNHQALNKDIDMDDKNKFCINCGNKIDKEAKFCHLCGHKQVTLNDFEGSTKAFIPEQNISLQEVFDTLNAEQKRLVEFIAEVSAHNNIIDLEEIKEYLIDINKEEEIEGKTIKEVFDTLNDIQKDALYTIVGLVQEDNENLNTYVIRLLTTNMGLTSVTINGIFIVQLARKQYYDFEAEVNVRYDIEFKSGIANLFGEKTLSLQEKTPLKNVFVGYGGVKLIVDHYDMTLDKDIELWVKQGLEYKEVE